MGSAVPRLTGRPTRRLLATAVLVVLPFMATTACANDVSPIKEDRREELEQIPPE
ncbi:MAG: hypothetical protein KY451_02815 [Actinobacteria bacterium]|nr:hypothetical protein [Actinomycetota bacterium]